MDRFDDLYVGQKTKDIKGKLSNKMHDMKDWVVRNRETIVVLAPVVIGVALPVVKTVSKHITLKRAKDIKELYCYDRSLGHYWKLKRELTNSEWVTIDRRKKCGERLADILSEMRVLK